MSEKPAGPAIDPKQSRPRQVADYLRALRPLLAQTTVARQTFIHGTGELMESVRRGEATEFAKSADGIAFEANASFHFLRDQIAEMKPPPACEGCHEAIVAWLDMLTASSDTLSEVGRSNQPMRLREVQSLMAESRVFSMRFKSQYDALVEQLRARNTKRDKDRVIAARKLFNGTSRSS